MGLIQELGYGHRPPNPFQRLVRRISSGRPGAWLLSKTLYRLDRPLYRLSRGRLTVPGVMAGLPVIMLTTTGARTGESRTMPLVGIPIGDDMAVVGTNYGQTATPGWVRNLEAHPAAAVGFRDRIVPVTARPADGGETEEVFAPAATVYGGYARYRERVDNRRIRAFVLEPTG